MSYTNSNGESKVGSLVMYLTNGKIAGKIIDIVEDKYFLDTYIIDGSRHAYVLINNEGKMWRICNERLHEYEIEHGILDIVIHPGFGGFSIYDENGSIYERKDRHNRQLVEKARKLIKPENGHNNQYEILKIPAYMVNHYRITEYDGAEDIELLEHMYKCEKIEKVCNGFKNAKDKMEEIKNILEMKITML